MLGEKKQVTELYVQYETIYLSFKTYNTTFYIIYRYTHL